MLFLRTVIKSTTQQIFIYIKAKALKWEEAKLYSLDAKIFRWHPFYDSSQSSPFFISKSQTLTNMADTRPHLQVLLSTSSDSSSSFINHKHKILSNNRFSMKYSLSELPKVKHNTSLPNWGQRVGIFYAEERKKKSEKWHGVRGREKQRPNRAKVHFQLQMNWEVKFTS